MVDRDVDPDTGNGLARSTDHRSGMHAHVAGNNWQHDLVAVFAALLILIIIGGGGAYVYLLYGTYRVPYVFPEVLAVAFWIDCFGLILARVPGELICGFVLGGFTRRISPWYGLAAIAAYLLLVIVVVAVFPPSGSELYVREVGALGIALRGILDFASTLGVVVVGICFGRAWRRNRTERTATRAPRQQIGVSP